MYLNVYLCIIYLYLHTHTHSKSMINNRNLKYIYKILSICHIDAQQVSTAKHLPDRYLRTVNSSISQHVIFDYCYTFRKLQGFRKKI